MPVISPVFVYLHVAEEKNKYTFWSKYKRFAGTELLLYIIMIVGIILGLIIFSK